MRKFLNVNEQELHNLNILTSISVKEFNARIKADAKYHTELMNNSIKIINETDDFFTKKKNLQIVKEQYLIIRKLLSQYDFLKVSLTSQAKVEKFIFETEKELELNNNEELDNPIVLVPKIRDAINNKEYDKAEQLLRYCIDKVEGALKVGLTIPSWYYEELAKIYLEQGKYKLAISILEEYLKFDRAPDQNRASIYKLLKKAYRNT